MLQQGHRTEAGLFRCLVQPWGRVQLRPIRLVEAIGDFDKAIALKPDFAAAYNNRGAAYLKAGRLDEAIRDFSRAIELQPDYADAFANRAAAYSQNGQYEQALADVQTYQAKGGRPPPMFVEALLRATGRSK